MGSSLIGKGKAAPRLIIKIEKKKGKSRPARQSQGGSAFVGIFPDLLRHGRISGYILEAQSEGLKTLLTLVEGTRRPLDEHILLACCFASHSTVKNKFEALAVFTGSPPKSIFVSFFLPFL